MSQSIGPPIQPAKQIAERAKLIVARAERETRDEAVQNSDKREGRIKDTPRIFQISINLNFSLGLGRAAAAFWVPSAEIRIARAIKIAPTAP